MLQFLTNESYKFKNHFEWFSFTQVLKIVGDSIEMYHLLYMNDFAAYLVIISH